MSIITLQYNDFSVLFQDDLSINATAIAKQFNKQPRDYLKQERTVEYMESIKRIRLVEQNQLITIKSGAPETGGGTWIHRFLVVDFARWLNPDFAVWCDMQIEKLLQPKAYGLKDLPPSTLTTEMKRHVQDMTSVLKHKSGKTHNSIYHDLKTRFNVASYTEIPIVKYADVCAYFGEKPKYTMPELIQCDARYLADLEQKLVTLEQKAKALPAPQPAFSIPKNMVLISAEDYREMKQKLDATNYSFDDFVFLVERQGGKVLMPSQVKDVRRIFKA